jgi:hypothetical protein
MDDADGYTSFMIRVWRDPARGAGQEEPVWMGEIESVQTGGIWTFEGVAGLVQWVAKQFGEDSTAAAAHGDP